MYLIRLTFQNANYIVLSPDNKYVQRNSFFLFKYNNKYVWYEGISYDFDINQSSAKIISKQIPEDIAKFCESEDEQVIKMGIELALKELYNLEI